MTKKKRVGVLISGRGSNLQALIDAARDPSYPAKIVAVISNVPSAQGLLRAEADFIAGLTIGLVVVPQAMAYAILAQLTPAYGLYTSFTGAVLYWLFGTSKDIVIGVSNMR